MKKFFLKTWYAVYVLMFSFISQLSIVNAKGDYEFTIQPSAKDPDKVAGALGGIICGFAQLVGAGFIAVGVFEIVKKIVSKDGEVKVRDIAFVGVGAVLCLIRVVLHEAEVIN